ncbi:hypothetical protein ACFYE9_30055 [Rhizobium leguminosarum]|uniref:Uncharacterized protein n=1 Tax=Rhizobium leguminosarum TaxID=384 RepID=A0ACD5FIV2_RHILE
MSNEPVVGNSEVKKLEERVRELERMLGRKTLEAEILREAISKAQTTKQISRPILLPKGFPMKTLHATSCGPKTTSA